MKNIIFIAITVIAMFLVNPLSVGASSVNVGYFGTTSESKYLWADASNGDDAFTRVDYVSNGSNVIEWYRMVGGSANYISSSTVSGSGSVTPPGGTAALKLKSSSGGEIYLTYAETTNPNSRTVYFESGSYDPDGNDGGTGGGGSNCGCVFNTPGWQEYMGKVDEIIGAIPSPPNYTNKLDEIIEAIPPAPNWNSVAETFRDTMAPRIKSDITDVLGYAPDLPSQPKKPNGINYNLDKPTGNDSGVKGFNESDVKDGERIPVKEDESGGFNILDPLENMPEQETFIPKEGDLEAPEVPDVEGEAPTPEEPENTRPGNPEEAENVAPKPTEPTNPLPSNPKDPENIAPTPSEPGGTAPTPQEPSNPAPTPGESENMFPIPGESNWGFPIPGNDGSTAPIPGSDGGQAPIPGQSTFNAPMPGG